MATIPTTRYPNRVRAGDLTVDNGVRVEPVTQQEQIRVASDTKLIELKSTYGISTLRDITTETGTGTVTNTPGDSEYRLRVQAASDVAALESAERGRYVPGYDALAGIGVRIPADPVGDMVVNWGLFDGTNGFYFGVDATGVYVAIERGGSVTKTYQSSWNVDKLDGSGSSGITLDISKGVIYNIQFTWYGYGVIQYKVVLPDSNGVQQTIIVHRTSPDSQTSVLDPNLPLRAEVISNTDTTDYSVYVAGRQYAILGDYEPNARNTAQEVLEKNSISGTLVPAMVVQRKSAYEGVSVKLNSIQVVANEPCVVEAHIATNVDTTASYGAFTNIATTETALQVSVDAATATGGISIFKGLADGGATPSRSGFSTFDIPQTDVPNNSNLAIMIRSVDTTGSATVSVIGSFREEW